jgi:hypothetical protein
MKTENSSTKRKQKIAVISVVLEKQNEPSGCDRGRSP